MAKAGVDTKAFHAEKLQATREWLNNQELHAEEEEDEEETAEDLDELESIVESSVVESSDDSDSVTDLDNSTISTTELGAHMSTVSNEVQTITQSLKDLFNSMNTGQTIGNVKIENSTGVHIGNITNINGNIQIIHAGNSLQQRTKRRPNRRRSPQHNGEVPKPSTTSAAGEHKEREEREEREERQERVRSDAFMERLKFKIPKELCNIIPRHTWLAQCPMDEYEYMQEPVEYVVIAHTATESSEKQAINIRIIRDIQCFHIESREWNDIAYNFLVGCDGNVYEGRNWGVVGAHTMGYNTRAIGISFIGCFMRVLPTVAALNACKSLLKRGVKEGHLAANYKLVCHCQCRSTESPGRKLFEELQKWEHFYNIEENDDVEE